MSDKSAGPFYRVGIVGTGGIARAHGRACAKLECLELAAICDISNEALNSYGETFEVHRGYLNLDEMLEIEELNIANWGANHTGTIGHAIAIRSTFCTGPAGGTEKRPTEKNWRFNKAKGGGSIFDLGCYCIHHARFIFDAEPISVFAVQQPGIEVDDAMFLMLVFPVIARPKFPLDSILQPHNMLKSAGDGNAPP